MKIITHSIIVFTFMIASFIVSTTKTEANYKTISISTKAQNEIAEFCKDDPSYELCQSGFMSKQIEKTYGLLKKDVGDFGANTYINAIKIINEPEIEKICENDSDGCWDGKNIYYLWGIFSYDQKWTRQVIAHEMLHAYATGVNFDIYPMEEGFVDTLALKLPSIAVHGKVDIGDTGDWTYVEMRNVAERIVDIYKLKNKGTDPNKIMIKILKGGSKEMKYILGEVETANYTKIEGQKLYQKASCQLISQEPKKVSAMEELTMRTYCLYYDPNFKTYYDSAMLLLDKLEKSLGDKGKGINLPVDNDTWKIIPSSQLLNEGGNLNVKYELDYPKAKTVFIALTAPDNQQTYSKSTICKFTNNHDLVGDSKGFYSVAYPACAGGKCSGSLDHNVIKTAKKDNYKLRLISFITSQESTGGICEASSILDFKEMSITINKNSLINQDDYGEKDKIKGKIEISSTTQVEKGEAVLIKARFQDHKDDELMLWITDCDGTYVPKILMSNHEAKKIPNDDYTYSYTWDTQRAKTSACKHTVQLKTFTQKNGKWLWNDMSRYEIAVGDNLISKMLCSMHFAEIKAEGEESTKKEVKKENDEEINDFVSQKSNLIVKGNQVILSWNEICQAKKYYIYRDNTIIGSSTEPKYTDTVAEKGRYEYKIKAYLQDISLDASIGGESGGGGNYDPNLSLDNYFDKLKKILLPSAKAEGTTPDADAESTGVVVTVEPKTDDNTGGDPANGGRCSSNQITLGMPIPHRDPGTGNFTLAYCVNNMADYMKLIYNILVVIASISALLMIIWGGYIYITSGGDSSKTTTAKEIMIGAVIGLVLLLCAGLIISTIGFSDEGTTISAP